MQTTTNTTFQSKGRRRLAPSFKTMDPAAFREPLGLTRAELRRLVEEMLG